MASMSEEEAKRYIEKRVMMAFPSMRRLGVRIESREHTKQECDEIVGQMRKYYERVLQRKKVDRLLLNGN